ncbi:MAG: hypothetical protein MPL62_04490 [Alphaproteobacteria bacterium]|nr:hypothetical protein [Alphaproteobacteria bacterium]
MSADEVPPAAPGYLDRIMEKIEAITTSVKPAPVDYWRGAGELVIFYGPRRTVQPQYSRRNTYGEAVALRQLDILFDVPSATTYAFVAIDGVDIYQTTNTAPDPHNSRQSPYGSTDISLDFKQGIRVPAEASVDVYLYDTDIPNNTGGHAANVFTAFGGI